MGRSLLVAVLLRGVLRRRTAGNHQGVHRAAETSALACGSEQSREAIPPGPEGPGFLARHAEHLRTGYLILGAIVAVSALLLTGFCRDVPRTESAAKAPTAPKRAQLAAFLSALGNHDFRWAFIGRALMVLGYFAVVGYQLYILDDHITLPAGLTPPAAMAVLTPVSMVAMALSTVLGGLLSDRLDRRKVFVGVSAALAGLVMVVPVVSPTWTGMLVFSALNGLAFGCFMAVDTALVTLVLPSTATACGVTVGEVARCCDCVMNR
ncbi:MFS transporter [Streptomyces sp. NBC_01233]|uniref:MFS transporter n=1 Tax=Streptomyces sp. NBC_01233 TaxID=2903787 RepID=UPI002E1508C8|nr:MFS transporter [Streptomyces sp. NBC_01233]